MAVANKINEAGKIMKQSDAIRVFFLFCVTLMLFIMQIIGKILLLTMLIILTVYNITYYKKSKND